MEKGCIDRLEFFNSCASEPHTTTKISKISEIHICSSENVIIQVHPTTNFKQYAQKVICKNAQHFINFTDDYVQ